MSLPTPYDGSSPLFKIGTRPIDPAHWLEPDAHRDSQLAQKARLCAARLHDVFAELPESRAAQTELLPLVSTHLRDRFPDLWRHSMPEPLALHADAPPLLATAKLVQDDLLLLQRNAEGWRLTAGCLCFPSSWLLGEKMGKVLADIHAPVPGFGPATRQAEIMARMFDAMRPETPLIRWNFSLYGDDRLYHPDVSGPGERRFGLGERADPVFLRVERQTLRKLPETGALAFTIRISVDPLERLEQHAQGSEIAASLAAQIADLTPEQLDYKGLTLERERLLRRLEEIFASTWQRQGSRPSSS